MSIKTVQDYANMKGTSPQNIINKKSIPLVTCGIYALYKGEYIHLKDQKFVEVENNEAENQQVIK
jgi:hypothetical protein